VTSSFSSQRLGGMVGFWRWAIVVASVVVPQAVHVA
jgi:hypothetical protein